MWPARTIISSALCGFAASARHDLIRPRHTDYRREAFEDAQRERVPLRRASGAGIGNEADGAAVSAPAEEGAQPTAFRGDAADRDRAIRSSQTRHGRVPLAERRPRLDEHALPRWNL